MKYLKIPEREIVETFVYKLFTKMFPASGPFSEAEFNDYQKVLQQELPDIISGLTAKEEVVSGQFADNLPTLRQELLKDANYILDSDPAATTVTEVIAIYPGFFAIFCYRTANFLARKQIRLFPRMITEYAHRTTGIDIHPLATIGSPFSIDHGTGIVIGETAEIGNYVKLYQGVTIGALSVDKSKASKKRHPTIEDNVILYSGCTILGGKTVVGRNSIIGGNVWLTESVAPFSVVYHKSEIVVRDQSDFKEPLNFII